MSTARWFGRHLLLIAATAGGLRVVYLLAAKTGVDACGEQLCGDAIYYSAQAETIADGGWFTNPFSEGTPAADHPPLTALVASLASLLAGGHLPQRLVMTIVGTAAVIAIGMLGREVGGPRVGLIAAATAALYPNIWVNDALVMSESLTALLVTGALWAAHRLNRDPSLRMAAMAGAICGLAVLARAELAMLVPITMAPALLAARAVGLRDRFASLAVLAATAGLLIAPWVIRNLSAFEEPVLLSTNDGLTLLGANCDAVYYGGGTGLWSLECGLDVQVQGDQSQVAAAQREAAIEYIGDHQRRIPAVMLVRVLRTWSLYAPDQMVWYNVGEGRERWVSWAGFAAYVALLPSALAGAVISSRRGTPLWPLLSTAVLVTITSALFYGIIRFRMPAEVSIVVLAAVALDAGWTRYTRSRGRRLQPA